MSDVICSALMPTYGLLAGNPGGSFAHVLEEAVESFVRQDFPADQRELIILNDCAGQEYTISPKYGNVRILNLPYRLPCLGDKYNLLCELARGKYLFNWEHDDVSLPHRMTQALWHIESMGWKCNGYFNPGSHWLLAEQPAGPEGKGLFAQAGKGVNHNAAAFTKELWQKVGGYARLFGKESAGQDAEIDSRMKEYTEHYGHTDRQAIQPVIEFGDTKPASPLPRDKPELFSYLYRWAVSPYHLSGNAASWEEYGRRIDQHHKVYGTVRHELNPHYRKDYEVMIALKLRPCGLDSACL